MSYYIFYAILLFAGLAMTVREGLWANTLTLVNILISGLMAFGLYSPLVVYLDEEVTSGQHTYWLDFAVLWAIFCVSMLVCRTLTGAFSKTRMRFKHPIDPVGGPAVGFLAAWVLAAFALATLHTSPMPKDAFGGNLASDSTVDSASLITSPDAAWIRFVAAMSKPNAYGSEGRTDLFSTKFVKIYSERREKFEKAPTLIVKRG
jgi:uncharacterized membrane protein required for colicin V production